MVGRNVVGGHQKYCLRKARPKKAPPTLPKPNKDPKVKSKIPQSNNGAYAVGYVTNVEIEHTTTENPYSYVTPRKNQQLLWQYILYDGLLFEWILFLFLFVTTISFLLLLIISIKLLPNLFAQNDDYKDYPQQQQV